MRVQVFIMSFYSNKEKMESNNYKDICRNHSTKADREVFRVCPSKLSKRELEDLYFNLLENNLELKKTINGQQDKIRVLSTQVQRMTNMQEKLVSREMKDRGTATKAVVDGQKDFITELKETNQRLADRIQLLNMRLCSAKQFMKTTPPQVALSRGNRSSATAASTPKKHDCLSKAPESPEQVLKVSTFSQWEEKTPRKANQNQITVPIEKTPEVKSDQPCDENKCRTLMEELKLKIVTLQDELISVHGEYATRIGRLETEVLEVRKENIRVISERSASELELTDTFKKASDLLTQYRIFEAKCVELTTELAIERRKVAELETQLRAANMSDKVNKTIEDHLTTKQDASPKCMKCCFKDEMKSTGSPSPRTDEGQPPSAGATSVPGDPSCTNTGDDSGYQDTDEQGLLKQNRELMAQILELQRQVDCMKIGGASESEDKPSRTSSPDTKESAPINSPPLLGETPEAETPLEQIEQSLKDENYECIKPIPSEDRLNHPRKILRIEVLGNPEESCRTRPLQRQMSEDTRAKTIEDEYGTQYIADDPEPVPDKYGYPDLPNNGYKEHRWNSPKFELEKKKREGSMTTVSKQDPGNISLKSATRVGPGFNPEKLKYLEAEGLTADMPELIKKESLESVPSNPELGFGIPRLASKASQERYKCETDSAQPKKSLSTSISNVREPAALRLPGYQPVTPAQAHDTVKDKEDCEFCAACSYDKECSHAIKPTMDKLALGVQMERAKKQDQHNSYQIPGPILSLDNVKKEKKKNLFGNFRKQKKESLSGEDLVLDPRVYAKKTSDTADGTVDIADVPLLQKRENSETDYMLCKGSEVIQKPYDKKDRSRKHKKGSKEDLIVDSRVYAQQTCETAGAAVEMADVPLLEKTVVESQTDGPGEADTKQKLPEKSSQAPSYKDSSWHSDVSPYRRRSGTYCFRRTPLNYEPPICRCAGQQDGSCSHVPKTKGTQAVGTQENLSPREKRRAAPTSDRGTYTLESKQTDTSPDNTDLEMSYLSDLPMEKEKKSPLKSRPLSPGEDRTTTYTSTLSGLSPPTNYSLSEGEMPAPTSKRRHSKPDSDKPYLNAQLAHKLETPPAQQMEAALQAITDELQRCKNLLHRHRPAEVTPMSTIS